MWKGVGNKNQDLGIKSCWYRVTHGFLWSFSLGFIRTFRVKMSMSTDLFYKCKKGDPGGSEKSVHGHRARQVLGLPIPCPAALPEDAVSFPRALMGDLFPGSPGSVLPVHLVGLFPQHS